MEITENLYHANCTPILFLLEQISRVGIPKFTVSCNYHQNVYLAALINEYGANKHYTLEMFRNN